MEEHGIDAVAAIVEEEGYPVSTRRLLDRHALRNVEIDERGNSMMLGELIDPADVREFQSRDDLERKVEPLLERQREARQRGLVGRILGAFR